MIISISNISFFTDKDQCTLKYVPFDTADATDNNETETSDTEKSTTNSSVAVGEVLTISSMNVVLKNGESTAISVTQIPKGYELNDLVFKTKNSAIATINESGVITANAEGSTTVIVSTSDSKYSCACSVTVVNEKTSNFTPLKNMNSNFNNIEVYAA